MLDHIFVSPALAGSFVSISALNERLPDEARVEAPVTGSLHAPVIASSDGLAALGRINAPVITERHVCGTKQKHVGEAVVFL